MREFEPLNGKRPFFVHDRHPDGRHIAMSIPGVDDEGQAAVWDGLTGALAWRPERAVALCWLRTGTEIALVTESYYGDLERRSWPGDELINRCEIIHREGWVDRVVASPKNNLAAVRWIDQTEAGFELFEIGSDGERQLKGKGYRVGGTNLIDGPVFSPSGRFLVLSEGEAGWWRNDDELEGPSQGGRFVAGRATVFDTRSFSARHFPIEVEVPEGWLPQGEEAELGLLGAPRFVTQRSFVIRLPTGDKPRFSVVASGWRSP